jgi:hypothetical protein
MSYPLPSQCTKCATVERLTNFSGLTWIVETTHQTTCPHATRGLIES